MRYPAAFLKAWHVAKLRIVTTGSQTIEEVLVNVTRPSRMRNWCVCDMVTRKLPSLPRTKGHILFTGRDVQDPTFRICAKNVPKPSWFDYFSAWERVRGQVPKWCQPTKQRWKPFLFKCLGKKSPYGHPWAEEVPDSKDVFQMKKKMDGLVIGPTDKNTGELWGACPILYHRAVRHAYAGKMGYETIFPARLSSYRKQRYTVEELPEQIMRTVPPPTPQRGGERDLVEMMRMIYKRKGWDEYAKFERKGGFNVPYVIFKAKNMIDMATREEKAVSKTRPIAPGTRHPAKKLLHYVGRAWSFATSQMNGEHFVINKSSEVPAFLQEAQRLSSKGELRVAVMDVKSCYPSMPREAIRFALRSIAREFRILGHKGVCVPKQSDTQPCRWMSRRRGMQLIPFEVMLDVMDFSLDFAIVKMPDGHLKRQIAGIPMGDPLSPGMAIGTCAWMEKEFMNTIPQTVKDNFCARRFMDDVILFYAEHDGWDYERFVREICTFAIYHPPLELEPGKEGTFLETRFRIDDGRVVHWLKNDNEGGKREVWRYQHFQSATPFMQKRATLTACLKKVERMASDDAQLIRGAKDKLAEFRALRYPVSVLRQACSFLAASESRGAWITARMSLEDDETHGPKAGS